MFPKWRGYAKVKSVGKIFNLTFVELPAFTLMVAVGVALPHKRLRMMAMIVIRMKVVMMTTVEWRQILFTRLTVDNSNATKRFAVYLPFESVQFVSPRTCDRSSQLMDIYRTTPSIYNLVWVRKLQIIQSQAMTLSYPESLLCKRNICSALGRQSRYQHCIEIQVRRGRSVFYPLGSANFLAVPRYVVFVDNLIILLDVLKNTSKLRFLKNPIGLMNIILARSTDSSKTSERGSRLWMTFPQLENITECW